MRVDRNRGRRVAGDRVPCATLGDMSDEERRGTVRVEAGHKRVRALLAGQVVLDTIRALYVWENPSYPAYYVPRQDVAAALAPPTAASTRRAGARPFTSTWP